MPSPRLHLLSIMRCSLNQYRASIGLFQGGLFGASLFYNFVNGVMKVKRSLNSKARRNLYSIWVFTILISLLLLRSGGIHLNPGPTYIENLVEIPFLFNVIVAGMLILYYVAFIYFLLYSNVYCNPEYVYN